MAGGSAIRGSRVGAGPMGEAERGESIARFRVSYWPPMPMKNEPYKTHLAYVKERRTEAEANKILDIALKKLRGDE